MLTKDTSEILMSSVQVNDGLRQTCGDGACLAFDSKYGIMFCAYMPGFMGDYGESRGRIALSCFPASQPTNIKFVNITSGNEAYAPNILSLGDGKVRVFYEKNSRAEGDHPVCYKDYDFLTDTLGEENTVMVKAEDGTFHPLGLSCCFEYLENNGYTDHVYRHTEQLIIGGCTYFKNDDGYIYGALPSELSEIVLFRSKDNVKTIEFFAIFPRPAQYEFDYKIYNDKIYAIYRTNHEKDATCVAFSDDFGKTWSDAIDLPESIQCRPRIILSGGKPVIAYNYFNNDSGNRPEVIMGRTAIRLAIFDDNDNVVVAKDLYSKYGIVNIALADVLGDVYLAYSTSELALEYQNGTPYVRGKDAVRYIKLGDLFTDR